MFDRSFLLVLILLGGLAFGLQSLFTDVHRKLTNKVSKTQPLAPLFTSSLRWAYRILSFAVWLAFAIAVLEVTPRTKDFASRIMSLGARLPGQVRDILFEPLHVGNSSISLFTLFQVVIFIAAVALLSRASRRVLLGQILNRTTLDLGIQHAVATFTQYFVIAIGLLVGLQTAGIDLSSLTILGASVGVGVGFGLQNIANNFISGIIILLERPIKIGDRIEVGDVNGDVVHIAARSTTVRTNDNIAIIIPNSSFISSNVINWSHGDEKVRFRVPAGVAYGSDVRLVERLLLEVARENENVIEDPPSRVIFRGFGQSALDFELRVWSSRMLHRRGVLVSQLNFAIYEKFKQHSITIPFPQRDLHIKGGSDALKHMVSPSLTGLESPAKAGLSEN